MKIFAITSFAFCLVMGVYLTSTKPYGLIYVELGDGRSPAAVQRTYDVSNLNGLALSKKIHERVVGEARLLHRLDAVGLELGQFVTMGAHQRKLLACAVYNRIELKFIAQGQASSSQSPEMTVEGDCKISQNNLLWIRPIWIPTQEILKNPTTMKHFSFYDDEPVSIHFQFVDEEWPKQWLLNSLKMYNSENPERHVVINRSEIRQAAPQSLLLEW